MEGCENNKYGFKILNNSSTKNIEKIGLNAVVNNIGFRNDGSMYYGGQIKKLLKKDTTANDFNDKDTFKRIKKGNKRFEYGEKVDSKAL